MEHYESFHRKSKGERHETKEDGLKSNIMELSHGQTEHTALYTQAEAIYLTCIDTKAHIIIHANQHTEMFMYRDAETG